MRKMTTIVFALGLLLWVSTSVELAAQVMAPGMPAVQPKQSRIKSFFSKTKTLFHRKQAPFKGAKSKKSEQPKKTAKPQRTKTKKLGWHIHIGRKHKSRQIEGHVETNVFVTANEAKLPAGLIRCSDDSDLVIHKDTSIDMQVGDVFVATKQTVVIHSVTSVISCPKGCCVLVSNRAGVLKVRNLCEPRLNSVKVIIDGVSTPIRAGQELVAAIDQSRLQSSVASDSVNRRSLHLFELPSGHQILSCEFEPATVIKHNEIIRSMLHSKDKDEKAAFNKVLKMAACLQYATASHGQYMPMAND